MTAVLEADPFASVRVRLVARPWPAGPLVELAGNPSITGLARLLGEPYTTVHVAQRDGLTDVQADRWAVALGRHPAEVWSDWYAWDGDD